MRESDTGANSAQKSNNVCFFEQNTPYLFKITNIMKKAKRELLPNQRRILEGLGENLRYARLRRDLSSAQVAERAGISRGTLVKIERGDETVALGFYFRVLVALSLEKDISLVARDDALGRKLQDAKLPLRERASTKGSNSRALAA